MELIKMEASVRNYLIRVLENYKEGLAYADMPNTRKKYEYEQIQRATDRLMGKEPNIALDKNQSPINFIRSDI